MPIELVNKGKQQITVYDEQFILIDEKDREYLPADVVMVKRPFFAYEELSPDLPKKFDLYYDIPYDEDLQYDLKLGKEKYGLKFPATICLQNCE